MLASKDQKIVEKIGKELIEHVRLNESWWKKTFVESWSTKHCIEQGDALHVAIKTNEPLLTNAYQVPLRGIALGIYNFKIAKTIEKPKAQQEGGEVVHNAFVEPMWVQKRLSNSIPM